MNRRGQSAVGVAAVSVLLGSLLTLIVATPLPADAATGMNRLGRFELTGGATMTVTFAASGQPQQRPVLRLPAAAVEVQCRRSGYRPAHLTYGASPLTHAVPTGRGRAKSFPAAKLRTATARHQFAAFLVRERGPTNQRVLAGLETAAWQRCAKGVGPATRSVAVAVSAKCKRIKGFGANWAIVGAQKTVPVRIECKGVLPSGKQPTPSKPPVTSPASQRHKQRRLGPSRPGAARKRP